MQCPSCHAAVAPDDRFCQNCGGAISPQPPAPPSHSTAVQKPAKTQKRNLAWVAVLLTVVAASILWPKLRESMWPELTKKPAVAATPTPTPPPNTKSGTLTETPIAGTQPVPPPVAKSPPVTQQPPPPDFPSQALLGSWRGGRHLTEFKADGTFLLDADIVPEPAGGVWKLEGRRLRQTYREGNAIVLDIMSIEGREMLTRDPATNQEFKYHREDNVYLNPDQLKTGDLGGDEFATKGLRMKALTGRLYVYDAVPPMMMPGVRKKTIMVDGDRITKLALEFDPPVRSFTMTLPGLTGGSSFPTFKMTAFNRAGIGFDVVGREHWIPSRPVPETIKMASGEMSRIEIAVDNVFGDTAWATFNCLPIVDMLLER